MRLPAGQPEMLLDTLFNGPYYSRSDKEIEGVYTQTFGGE